MIEIKSGRNCVSCNRTGCFINKYSSEEWKNFFTKNKSTYKVLAGEKIFTKGDIIKGAYTVYSGYIKVYDTDGKTERIVDLIGKEHILGLRSLGSTSEVYKVTAEALSDCEITFFTADILRLAIEANKELAFFIIDMLTHKLQKAEMVFRRFQKMNAKDKVICSLNDIIETFGTDDNDGTKLRFSPSRKDIASLASTTYETVIRVLSDLDKQNYLKIEGKELRILNKEFFKQISKEN